MKELNNVYGIYSGLKLLNLFSISTQVPNVVEIVTNNETMRCREIEVNGRWNCIKIQKCFRGLNDIGVYEDNKPIEHYKHMAIECLNKIRETKKEIASKKSYTL